MELAKITSKGQITIPVDIRRKLGVKEGDKVLFVEEAGRIYILNSSMEALREAQAAFSGEAERAGLKSEDDVVALLDQAEHDLVEVRRRVDHDEGAERAQHLHDGAPPPVAAARPHFLRTSMSIPTWKSSPRLAGSTLLLALCAMFCGCTQLLLTSTYLMKGMETPGEFQDAVAAISPGDKIVLLVAHRGEKAQYLSGTAGHPTGATKTAAAAKPVTAESPSITAADIAAKIFAPTGSDTINAIRCSPDGKYLISGGGYKKDALNLWDIAAGKVYGVRDEIYGPIRGRKYYGWHGHDLPLDTPLPVAITEEANTHA